MASAKPTKDPKRRFRGFERTSALLSKQVRRAGESRGFAVSRVLTHWAEIVGEDTAKTARPVNVTYGRQGFGATLTLLTTGAQAPMVEMQKEQIREKVNACYGYAAISRVRITQTAPIGFAEPQSEFAHKKKPTGPTPRAKQASADLSQNVEDQNLREALEKLGQNVLSRQERS